MLSKYFWPIRLAKLLTVHGDSLFASSSPRLPWLVAMLALTVAGSVGTLPVRGGLTGLAAGSCGVAWYWQLAPTLADGWNGGNGAAFVAGSVVDAELAAEVAGELLVVAAVLALCLLLLLMY